MPTEGGKPLLTDHIDTSTEVRGAAIAPLLEPLDGLWDECQAYWTDHRASRKVDQNLGVPSVLYAFLYDGRHAPWDEGQI
jgi:hypothetical protein